nr:MAG TPA: hypothetical protein [Caudoviricetes sp.]
MSDESKASILVITWAVAFCVGLAKGESTGLLIITLATAVFATIILLDMLCERAKAEIRLKRRRLAIRERFCREMAEIERGCDNEHR